VIGEDLGTVPRGLPSQLARWGILSSRVLLFERDRQGSFRSASQYSRRALVTANTYDLPTLAGFWSGGDLQIRRDLGLISEGDLAEGQRKREFERQALVRCLAGAGSLRSRRQPESSYELCAAVNAFLCKTPAPLVGLLLDDLAGETEPINVPGVPPERYPSWTRRMRLPVEALREDPALRSTLEGAAARARPPS
jgi:4-alpha-glucanotransferase